jgi:hypothetical protein
LGPKGLAKKLAKDTGKVAVGVPESIIRGNVKLQPSIEPPLMPPPDKAISYPSSSSIAEPSNIQQENRSDGLIYNKNSNTKLDDLSSNKSQK